LGSTRAPGQSTRSRTTTTFWSSAKATASWTAWTGSSTAGTRRRSIRGNQAALREKIEDGEEIAQFVKLHVRVRYPCEVLADMAVYVLDVLAMLDLFNSFELLSVN
jgi:hypothetical protein